MNPERPRLEERYKQLEALVAEAAKAAAELRRENARLKADAARLSEANSRLETDFRRFKAMSQRQETVRDKLEKALRRLDRVIGAAGGSGG